MSALDHNNIPNHIAIIMDGNGRWAKEQGKDRLFGHASGVEAVRDTLKTAKEL
jgi:undecaprenyl diphosphate synthase